MSAPSTTCGSSGNQVTLQWTPPTNTGGQGVVITHYAVTGLPKSASCSTGPCDMITGTTTTITVLPCNDSFIVSVRAFNCRGEGSSLQVPINLSPPGKCMKLQCIVIPILSSPQGVPSFSNTNTVNCIDNDDILLDWTVSLLLLVLITSHAQIIPLQAPMAVQSDCGSSLSYNLTVSDTDSSSPLLFNSTNARVAVGGSDNYTVTISASNGCPGLAKEIGEWMGTITAALQSLLSQLSKPLVQLHLQVVRVCIQYLLYVSACCLSTVQNYTLVLVMTTDHCCRCFFHYTYSSDCIKFSLPYSCFYNDPHYFWYYCPSRCW